ncbi:MAG TPA: DUF3501 family protein [Candidatus Sulfotelmatobacter sp.]|nr:DUF3501 family protein [Candidatus Sulfotelmatobacter sp.]
MKRRIEPGDVLPDAEYVKVRAAKRRELSEVKRRRRVDVGPFAMFAFESWDTMWFQVQEMLHVEKGGAAQVPDELAAYNPLIPQGSELVATVMFQIDDEVQRKTALARLGGVEKTAFLAVGGARIAGVPEADMDRTTAEGKASSVQFIHFPFTATQIAAFRAAGAQVVVGFDHPNYGHMAVMPEPVRAALAGDFE